jgi:hypothetical protein
MGLVRIRRVPLVNVGEYMLSEGGKVSFTEKMLASAIEHGKGLRARLGIGHIDPEYNRVHATSDGDLSFGQVDSSTLEFDGKTLWGDLENVDERLAQILPSNLPSRSIEGDILPDGTLRLTAVKLLGMTLPGVTDIPDIKALVREQEGVFVAASTADQEGTPFTVVLDMTTPVAASATNNDPKEDQIMDEKLRESLIALHGLADDATDEAILKAVAAAAAAKANDKTKETPAKAKTSAASEDDELDEEEDEDDTDSPTDAAELEEALAVAASHGLVVMPQSQFKTLRVAATKGAEAHDRLFAEDKAKEMRGHLERGAVTPDDVEKEWGPLYDKDAERCKRIMASLPDGMRAPTGRQGKVGDVDHDTNDKNDPFGGGSGLFPDLYASN